MKTPPVERPGAFFFASFIIRYDALWATCWGGELVFYDTAKENIMLSVQPKPKRVVVFNGEVPHGARAPAANCNRLRMSIAFKTLIRE
jgi:SM-20-related protein